MDNKIVTQLKGILKKMQLDELNNVIRTFPTMFEWVDDQLYLSDKNITTNPIHPCVSPNGYTMKFTCGTNDNNYLSLSIGDYDGILHLEQEADLPDSTIVKLFELNIEVMHWNHKDFIHYDEDMIRRRNTITNIIND